MLRRVDVNNRVLEIIDNEVRLLLKMVTGGDTVNPLHMIGIKMKVRGMLKTVVPELKDGQTLRPGPGQALCAGEKIKDTGPYQDRHGDPMW